MLITLLQEWRPNGSFGDRDYDQSFGNYYGADRYDFDTDTLQVVFTAFPAGGSYTQETSTGEAPPENLSLATDFEFHFTVQGPTRTGYFHDGVGGFTTDPHTIVATATVTDNKCFGAAGGIVELELSADSPAGIYTYSWSDGATTADRDQLVAGNYTVTIRHESGAQLLLPVTVGQNTRIEVVIDKTDQLVTLRVSGGTAPYTYAWDDDPAQTTNTRSDLADGTYACTITDSLGCQTTVVVGASEFRYYFVRNPIALPLDAGDDYRADPSTLPGLTFACQVLVERDYLSGVFEPVGTELEQPADRAGRTTFQVQELLAPELAYHVPPATGPVGERATALFRRFYLRHAQLSGEPPVRSVATDLVQHYALLGGLSSAEAAARTWFNSYQPGRFPFLTWDANDKAVFADQPEFLYFQSLAATAQISCRFRLNFTDGSSQVGTMHRVLDVARFEVFCFGVGYAQLVAAQLTPASSRLLVDWQVDIVDGEGNGLSETRRYVLDRRVKPFRRYLLYANSLGGMNTFVATGEAQHDAELSGEQVELTRSLAYDPLVGDTAVLERELKPVLKLASGVALGSAAMLALQELLLSRRVLLLNSGRWLAGYLKTKTVNLLDDGKTVPTLEVEFVLPIEQQFTPYLPPTPAGTTPAAVGPESGRL
ncbi:hypothetical protein CDA63_11700 [Hymenobacter amundsenii]|uniref:Ig-like domain-containing protein n=1 Tax=Hymenobacter amundsenii TaxID=2006685 RepID=A0A246FJX7_9BACT|nr:SprB repeat-containing protein [Hymenobacter amundsenii]OWP62875.1 hypothetical protein CDA63_11700 [Hymenobacter amundsenii]